MNIVTELRHYVSTWPYRETKDYENICLYNLIIENFV